MYTPGFYKTDHRKLTLGEMVRWYGFWRLPVIYFATRKPPRPLGFWMPALWADLECQRNELSDRFWTATARQREDFERLGFAEISFGKIKPSANLHPSARDDGKLTYLDATRSCIGMLFYTRMSVTANHEFEHLTIAFSRVFNDTIVSSSNNKRSFKPTNGEKVVRVVSDNVATVHSALVRNCARRTQLPQVFPDDASLRTWFDGHQLRTFESRVRRGLFVKMTDEEIAAARAQMPVA